VAAQEYLLLFCKQFVYDELDIMPLFDTRANWN